MSKASAFQVAPSHSAGSALHLPPFSRQQLTAGVAVITFSPTPDDRRAIAP